MKIKMLCIYMISVLFLTSCGVDSTPSDTVTSDSNQTSADSNPTSGSSTNISSMISAQKMIPAEVYGTFSTTTTEKFLLWCKSNGEEKVNDHISNYKRFKYNDNFLEWVQKNRTLLIPVFKDKNYKLSTMKVVTNKPYYKSVIDEPVGYTQIYYFHSSLFPGSEDASIPEIIETLTKNGMNVKEEADEKITKGTKNIKWGEYYCVSNGIKHMTFTDTLTNSSYDEDLDYIASYFKVEDFLVKIVRFGETEWDDNYFDYFDYERISW